MADAAAPAHSRSSSTDSATASTNPPSSPSPPDREANHHIADRFINTPKSPRPRPQHPLARDSEPRLHDPHHQPSRGPLPRVASTGKLLKHHHPRPLAANRSVSFGKNLNKLASHSGHHDAAAVGGGATPSASRHPYRRPVSASLTSPTYGSLGSARPSHYVKRNASAMVVSRGGPAHLAALKKNLSSGHLQRHGRGASKAGKLPAPLPKQSRAPRGETGQRALRSPKSPTAAQHAVRFDLGSEVAPGDETDDTEWVEDSASISPVTTRDNTRHNSVIIDSKAPLTASPTSEITYPPASRSARDAPQEDTQGIYQSTPVGSAPKPDTVASRLLQRGATTESVVVSTVSATAVNTPTPQSTLSHSQGSTLNDDDSNDSSSIANSGGRNLVSRFVNTSSSNGTPADLRGSTLLGAHPIPRNEGQKAAEYQGTSAPGELHLRQRPTAIASSSKAPAAASSSRAAAAAASAAHLPQSRTQQKLELQRASSVLETTKHIQPVLPRPSAPQILHSGIHSFEFGFGLGEGDYLPAQIQSLYAQIGKEYGVVRRFRQPVEEALARMELKRDAAGGAPGSPSPAAAAVASAAATAAQKGKFRAAMEPQRGRRLVDTDTPRAVYAAAAGGSPAPSSPHALVARAPNAEIAYAKPHPHPHPHSQHRHAHLGPSPLKSGHHLDRESGAGSSAPTVASLSAASMATVTPATATAVTARAAAEARKSRVSFNVPPARALAAAAAASADESERDDDLDDDEEDDDDEDGPLVLVASSSSAVAGRERHSARHDEALEISRRLWDLGNAGREDLVVGK